MSTPHTRTTVRPAVDALGGALAFVACYLRHSSSGATAATPAGVR
jgi:hypothetical protein